MSSRLEGRRHRPHDDLLDTSADNPSPAPPPRDPTHVPRFVIRTSPFVIDSSFEFRVSGFQLQPPRFSLHYSPGPPHPAPRTPLNNNPERKREPPCP